MGLGAGRASTSQRAKLNPAIHSAPNQVSRQRGFHRGKKTPYLVDQAGV